jgi:thiamine biosynthesis lipoprotein
MKYQFLFILILSLILTSCSEPEKVYHFYEGPIHGTSFHITYEYYENKDLENEIQDLWEEFELSLSNYKPESIISRINANDEEVETDRFFRTVFMRAEQISRITNGAFDITVAPLVNAYGFGFDDKKKLTDGLIEELLSITGYEKVRLQGDRIIKDDPRVMLDVSAIAKGFSVDCVSLLLEEKGVGNYLVEIGGEMRCKGKNPDGVDWNVGIDKPIENMLEREIQAIISLSNASLATSGNYRQFRIEDDIKYSHTIDPSTGRPVTHNLLSATVIAEDCMTADSYATAFMVMGLDKSMEIVESDPKLEAYFIYSGEDGFFKTQNTSGLEGKINDSY